MLVTGAVVCTVPSGNFNPPRVISTMPSTVKGEVGVVVPMPTLPNLSSVMYESPSTPGEIYLATRSLLPVTAAVFG